MPTLPANDFGISKTKALSDQTDFRFNKFLTEFLLCESAIPSSEIPEDPSYTDPLMGNSKTPY